MGYVIAISGGWQPACGFPKQKPALVAQGGFSECQPPQSAASASFNVLLGRIAADVLAKSGR